MLVAHLAVLVFVCGAAMANQASVFVSSKAENLGCKGDPHARVKQYPLPCPSTCEAPDAVDCKRQHDPVGCECELGYILSTTNGKCILPDECRGGNPCGSNGTFAPCTSFGSYDYCPVDDSRDIKICDLYPFPPCYPGCICKQNYKRLSYEDNRCILASDCPPVECTRQNEVWDSCPKCLAEYCPDVDKQTPVCCTEVYICEPRCVYSCPRCGIHEEPFKNKVTCPPDTCESIYSLYACEGIKPTKCGCKCINGYLRNSSKICVPSDQCQFPKPVPQCDINEEPFENEVTCPPDTCESIYSLYACEGVKPTEVGCKCIDGHLRNSSNICVPSDQCPPPINAPQCGINEEPFENEVTCPPDTCESIYSLYACEGVKPTEVGCKCINGHLRNSSNICVPSDQCPPPINAPQCGINEEPFENEVLCPPDTCESIYSSYACEGVKPTEVGCKCIDGYLRNSSNICVPSDQCPPPNPCGPNGTLSDCGFRCPNQYCPADDSQLIILCKPPRDCPSGCLCKENYKRISTDDDTCVLASDCPPVNCTRPNEVWNPCSQCLAERCEDINVPNICDDPPGTNCDPRCVCAKGHYRNDDNVCVPAKKCPNKLPNTNQCIPTCAVPSPEHCQHTKLTTSDDDGCQSQCKEGYILSEEGGKCIKIEDCPKDLDCNGDPHATVKQCPQPCPSTCNAPNANPCKRKCDPVGCECKPGYIRSEVNGKCILPDDCKGGNPCGPNARFVECRYSCPTDYCPVDDNRGILICEPFPFSPCLSGCMCQLNHKRLSYKDDRCIVSSDCPPVECTRPNEIWDSCPSDCLSEYCEDVDKGPVVCNTLVLNCQPKCVCKKNHFRNKSDICVSANECRKLNANNQTCNE